MIGFLCTLADVLSGSRSRVTASPSLITLAIRLAPGTAIDDRLARRLYRRVARALLAHPQPVLSADQDGRSMKTRPSYPAHIQWSFPASVVDQDRRLSQGTLLHALGRRIAHLHRRDRRFRNRFQNDALPRHRIARHSGPPDLVFAHCGELPFPVPGVPAAAPLTATWYRTEAGRPVAVAEEPLRIQGYDDLAATPVPVAPAVGPQPGGTNVRIAGSARQAPLVLDHWFGNGDPAWVDRGWIDIDFPSGTATGDGLHVVCTPVTVADGPGPRRAVWRCTAPGETGDARHLELAWTIPPSDTPGPARSEHEPMAPFRTAPDQRPAPAKSPAPALRGERKPPTVATPEAGTIMLAAAPVRAPEALEVTGLVVPVLNPRGAITRCEVAFDSEGTPLTGGGAPVAVELAVFRDGGATVWWRWPGEKWRRVRSDDPQAARRALADRLRPPPAELRETVAAVLTLPRPVPVPLPPLPAVLGHRPDGRTDTTTSRIRFAAMDGCGMIEQNGRRTPWGTLNLSRDHLLIARGQNGLAVRLLGRTPAWMLDATGGRITDRLTAPGDPRTLELSDGCTLLVGSFEVTYRRNAL